MAQPHQCPAIVVEDDEGDYIYRSPLEGEPVVPEEKKRRSRVLRAAIARALEVGKRYATMTKEDAARYNGYLHEFADPDIGTPWILNALTEELEKRGQVTAIYRTPSDPREVRKLKKKFKSDPFPKLKRYDSHVLANTILSFLSDLKEPLIPRSAWRAFVMSGQLDPMSSRVAALQQLMHMIPEVNRRTIGLILRHLTEIASQDPARRHLQIQKLAEAFAPMVIGFSSPEKENDEDEYELLTNTMIGLLYISGDKFMCYKQQ